MRFGEVTLTAAVEGARPGAAAAGWAPAGKTIPEVTTARVVPAGMFTEGWAWSNDDCAPEQVTSTPAMLYERVPWVPGSKVKVAVSGHTHHEPWSSQVPIERVTERTISGPDGVALGVDVAVGAAVGTAVGGAVAGGLVRGGAGAGVDGVRITGA
jgi:hypothetical protein